jgi:hypothetical protein
MINNLILYKVENSIISITSKELRQIIQHSKVKY